MSSKRFYDKSCKTKHIARWNKCHVFNTSWNGQLTSKVINIVQKQKKCVKGLESLWPTLSNDWFANILRRKIFQWFPDTESISFILVKDPAH